MYTNASPLSCQAQTAEKTFFSPPFRLYRAELLYLRPLSAATDTSENAHSRRQKGQGGWLGYGDGERSGVYRVAFTTKDISCRVRFRRVVCAELAIYLDRRLTGGKSRLNLKDDVEEVHRRAHAK